MAHADDCANCLNQPCKNAKKVKGYKDRMSTMIFWNEHPVLDSLSWLIRRRAEGCTSHAEGMNIGRCQDGVFGESDRRL